MSDPSSAGMTYRREPVRNTLGDLVRQHVTQETAADRGDGTDDHSADDPDARLCRPDDREQAESHGVEADNESFERCIGSRHEQCGDRRTSGDGEQPAFPHGNRWKVGGENVAHDSTGQSGDEPEGDDADEIEISSDGEPGVGLCEDAEIVEDRHKAAVECHGGAEPTPARRRCAGAGLAV